MAEDLRQYRHGPWLLVLQNVCHLLRKKGKQQYEQGDDK